LPLKLTTEHDRAIREHGARDYPNECCGFLIGRQAGDTAEVVRTQPAGNTREDSPRNRFEIDPGDFFRTDRAARAEGLGIVGFYHSHPDAPARPSNYDRERGWPGYCYVIVSVIQREPQDMTNWRLDEESSGFQPDPIVIEEAR
jgi:proteasome lid subunit RPN8/RPN11